MLQFASDKLDENQRYKLISAIITPRPIAWVASLNPAGSVNLAPFSSYTFVSYNPPKLLFSVGPCIDKPKDTVANIEARGEFTVNSVTPNVLGQMVDSAFAYDRHESEAELLGIELAASSTIQTPRVAGVAAAMECRLDRIIPVGDPDDHRLVIGTVTSFHVDPAIWSKDRIDPKLFQPMGRIGGPLYHERGEIIVRPVPKERAG